MRKLMILGLHEAEVDTYLFVLKQVIEEQLFPDMFRETSTEYAEEMGLGALYLTVEKEQSVLMKPYLDALAHRTAERFASIMQMVTMEIPCSADDMKELYILFLKQAKFKQLDLQLFFYPGKKIKDIYKNTTVYQLGVIYEKTLSSSFEAGVILGVVAEHFLNNKQTL
jgi:hypothetical protein